MIYDELKDLSGDMKELKSLAARHDKTLYGNGQPGVVARVQQVENEVAPIKKAYDHFVLKFFSVIFGSIVAGVGAGIAIFK